MVDSKTIEPIEADNKMVIARAWNGGNGRCWLSDTQFQLGGRIMFFEINFMS